METARWALWANFDKKCIKIDHVVVRAQTVPCKYEHEIDFDSYQSILKKMQSLNRSSEAKEYTHFYQQRCLSIPKILSQPGQNRSPFFETLYETSTTCLRMNKKD